MFFKFRSSCEHLKVPEAMQRGLGEAARSWEGSAVLGVSPMIDCRGSPHEQLPWS
ncbi:MAG: hypothetical protein F6K20_14510, partial [Moorea sp. SIO2C4]|nr:hypothetical protein [Moorena sp. SIO2C4]